MANKLTKQYVRRVCARIPICGSRKKQFGASLQEHVAQYLEENPSTDYAQLEAHFGTPDDIAADFIAQMSYQQIHSRFHARDRIVAIVSTLALVVAISWAGMVVKIIDLDGIIDDGYSDIQHVNTYHWEER